MDILHLSNCNLVIGKPSDMTDQQCVGLPVEVYTDDDNCMWCRSFWKPSEEEVAMLVKGGAVALHVRAGGRQHPVVSVGTTPLE